MQPSISSISSRLRGISSRLGDSRHIHKDVVLLSERSGFLPNTLAVCWAGSELQLLISASELKILLSGRSSMSRRAAWKLSESRADWVSLYLIALLKIFSWDFASISWSFWLFWSQKSWGFEADVMNSKFRFSFLSLSLSVALARASSSEHAGTATCRSARRAAKSQRHTILVFHHPLVTSQPSMLELLQHEYTKES